MMPTTRSGMWALRLCVMFGCFWLGNYALEAWARMPVSNINTKLLVMISYAYFTLSIGVISGIMAVVAKFCYCDTSKVIWVPIGVGMVLCGAVVRSLLWS
jgi:hypothetical protein